MDFSLIIPCYNEEENLRVFIPTAIARLEALDASCEMVFVDDGSSDATFQVIEEQIAACEKQVGRSDERAPAPPPAAAGPPAASGRSLDRRGRGGEVPSVHSASAWSSASSVPASSSSR